MTEDYGVADGDAFSNPSLRSRFNSFFSSRFCSFRSFLVRFSVEEAAGVTLDEDVDVAAGDAVAPTPRALNCWPSDFALPRAGASAGAVAIGEGDEIVSGAAGTVATGVGNFDVAGFVGALGVGVLWTSNRPRR